MKKQIAILSLSIFAIVNLTGCVSLSNDKEVYNTDFKNKGVGEEGYFYTGGGEEDAAPIKAVRTRESKTASTSKAYSSSYSTTSIAYPTGRKDNSILWIEKNYPATVKIGKPYTYTIKVTNLTTLDVPEVVISEQIPTGFQVNSSSPDAANLGGKMNWALGKLSPKESKTISITGMTDEKAELPCCTSASYDPPTLCVNTSVVQPELTLALTTVAESTTCERIPLKFVVTNPGDTTVTNVKVTSQLPRGVTSSGKSSITINVGSLAAGTSKEFTEVAAASAPGFFPFVADATASDGLMAKANAGTNVTQPSLTITASPLQQKQFVGRPIGYSVSVSNTGNAPAESITLSANLVGAAGKSASKGGSVSGRSASWKIGTLAPGASESVTLDATAVDAGLAKIEAMAEANCSADVSATASTEIIGISAILLEVVDQEDPIEVGNEETYVISVTNQGSAADTNVRIVAVLDDSTEYVSSSGATRGSTSGKTITFAPLAKIEAKESVEWKIIIRGTEEADARIKVSLNSDQLTKSVDETEATTIY